MRRPLALFGFTFLGCAFCYMVFGKGVTALLLGVALFCVIACMLYYKSIRKQPIGLAAANLSLGIVFSCVLLLCAVSFVISPMKPYQGTTQSLTMTVLEERGYYDQAGYYTVTALMPNGQSSRLKLQVKGDARYRVGDVVKSEVQLTEPPSYQTNRLLSERIVLVAKTDPDAPPTLVGQNKNVYYYAYQANRALYRAVYGVLPRETAAMVVGICLGDTSALSQEVMDRFAACGMSHMTAVSGLHTTILVGFLVALFVFFRWHRRWASLIGIALIWTFIFIVGLPSSAVRAGVMFTILAGVAWFRYTSDTLNNLGGAVLAILLLNPFAVGDIGFVASMSACLGIVLYADRCGSIIRLFLPRPVRAGKYSVIVTNHLGVTVSAFTANLFCSVLRFYQFSLVAPVANLIGVPMAGVILVCTLLGGILTFVPGLSFCGGILLAVGGLFANGLMWVARTFGSIPLASIPFASPWCLLATVLVLVIGVLAYRYRRKLSTWGKRGIALLLVAVLMGTAALSVYPKQTYEVIVVGNERESAVAVLGQGECVVIGCASVYWLSSVLASRQVRQIDCLILPPQDTCGSSLKELNDRFVVERIVAAPQNIQRGLVPFVEPWRLSSFGEVQVGNTVVTANESFTKFAIEVAQTRLVYRTESDVGADLSETVTITTGGDGTVVATDTAAYVLEDMLCVKLKGNAVQVYRPQYLYG